MYNDINNLQIQENVLLDIWGGAEGNPCRVAIGWASGLGAGVWVIGARV